MSTILSNPSSSSEDIATEKASSGIDINPDEVPTPDNGLPKSDPQNDGDREQKKSANFKITIFMLCFVSVVVAMDSVIVAAALPAITVSLKGNTLEAFWIGTSYLLAQTVTVPLYGTISDIFGRKWVMIFAIFLFTIGSILCATAQNMDWLVGARVVQGLGGGGVLTLASVIISDITTLRERPIFLSMGALAWALGTNIGVPVGGAIGEFTSWRWVFWINIPICVIGAAGIIYALHLHQEITSLRSKLARVDYLGISVFVASVTLLLYGLTTGGTSSPWSSAKVLAPLILGFAGLAGFVFVEWKVAKAPMVPLRIFANRSTNVSYIGAFVHGLVLWAFTYYLIIFFLGARRDALFKSSAETLPGRPVLAPVALSAVVCGIIVRKTLRYRNLTWIAWVLVTLGTGLNTLMKPHSSAFVTYALRIIPAIGGGFLFQLPLFAVQANSIDDDLGMATAMITFCRSIGQAFGVAIGGTVFQNEFDRFVLRSVTKGKIPKEYVVNGAEAAGAYKTIGKFPETVVEMYKFVYADSLRTVWYVTTGLAGVALILSLLVRNGSMDRGNNSKQAFNHEREKMLEKSEKA